MRILFVAAEAAPLAKVGGLADVVGSLPAALRGLGHDVRVMMPAYGCADSGRLPVSELPSLETAVLGQARRAHLFRTTLRAGVTCYLVGSEEYFAGPQVYTDADLERFLFFSQAVVAALPELDWQPEMLHCHDWHTGLVPALARRAGYGYPSVFTVHNLAYQGWFDEDFQKRAGLAPLWQDIPPGAPPVPLSYISQGIVRSDQVTTVSETYAREIQSPENGAGLDALLRYRADSLTGIVNGLDSLEYDPSTDSLIAAKYGAKSPAGKARNKRALQERLGLPVNAAVPLIGMVQRLDEQKGIDILAASLASFMGQDVQLVLVGNGRPQYEEMVSRAQAGYPGKAVSVIGFDNPLAHLVYAASDLFLMPSRFEPCGLGQLIAMRYGAVPVVRRTGGLAETVADLSRDLGQGSGFVFDAYTPEALAGAVRRALEAYRNQPEAWRELVRRVMRLDFSWEASARKYEAVYERARQGRDGPGDR